MPTNFDHLIAFVSDQAVDAVSVLFDQRFRVSRVTLLGLERNMQNAESIGMVIERRLGVKPEFQTLPSPHNPAEFCRVVEDLLRSSPGRLAVNLNTNDAVCACLALQAAARVNTPVFAVETQYDRLVWLSEAERSMSTLDIEDQLRSLDVFAMHGFDYVGTSSIDDYAKKLACAQRLMQIAILDESLIPSFLPKTGLTPRLTPGSTDLVSILKGAGLLKPSPTGRLQFSSYEAVAFVRGSWLELVVFDALAVLAKRAGVVDSHRGLCVRHKSSRLLCEFDIVFMLQNALHIIECKSGDSRGGKFLTHFEGMTRSHGLRARTMLVSVDRLSDTLVAAADGMGIAQIHGAQLSELPKRLGDWMRG